MAGIHVLEELLYMTSAFKHEKNVVDILLGFVHNVDIKLVTTDVKRNKLVSEPTYHPTKRFSENLLAIEMKKTKVKVNKPVYLGMSMLDISKMLMYKFWYDYIKPKYEQRAKLCYTDTDNFIIHIITADFFVDISDDVERWFDTCKYDENDKIKK